MSNKSTSTANATADTLRDAAIAGGHAVPELSRQQFARGADWAAASFRTAGALQQVNVQMCQRAALLHAQAAENARKAGSPIEMAQVQSSLLVYHWLEMTRYSQEWMLACSRALKQPAAAGPGDAPASTAANGTSGFTDAALGAAAPMVQAWQQMFAGLASESRRAAH
jgi:hypothetical protein